jgi:HEAT repeat protein
VEFPVNLLVVGVGVVIALLLASYLAADTARWFEEELRVASVAKGFRFERRRRHSRVARGWRDDYHVQVEIRAVAGQEEDGRAHDHLLVSLRCDRFPQRVGFSPERGSSADILTGDRHFDDAVQVQGEPTILAALLDQPLRFGLRKLVAWDGSLGDGQISWRAPVTFVAGQVPRALGELVELADLLTAAKGGICERQSRNARDDESPGVRLWNLTLLQQHFADRPEAREASRALLADRDPWVRLAAARFLPDESPPVLRGLLDDRETPDHAAAEAAVLLGARLPAAEAGPLLTSALKRRSGEARRLAMQELGRIRHGPAVNPLCVLLDRADPRTAAAAAEALGTIGDAKAEAHLLDAVRHDEAELRIAAAHALGALGTVRAVEPLLELLAAKRIDGESRQALREAVGAIQSRLAGAEAGQLSLAPTAAEAGRLSLATPQAGPGDVSLASEPERRPGYSR